MVPTLTESDAPSSDPEVRAVADRVDVVSADTCTLADVKAPAVSEITLPPEEVSDTVFRLVLLKPAAVRVPVSILAAVTCPAVTAPA